MWLSKIGQMPWGGVTLWDSMLLEDTPCDSGPSLYRAGKKKIDLIYQITSSCRIRGAWLENSDSSIAHQRVSVKFLKFLQPASPWKLCSDLLSLHVQPPRGQAHRERFGQQKMPQEPVGIVPTCHSQGDQNLNLCIQVVLISRWRLLDTADTWEQGTALYLNSANFNPGVFFQ